MNQRTPGFERARKINAETYQKLIDDTDPSAQVFGHIMRRLDPAIGEALHDVLLGERTYRYGEVEAGMAHALAYLAQMMAVQLVKPGRPLPVATALLVHDTIRRTLALTDFTLAQGGVEATMVVRNKDGSLADHDALGDFLRKGR